MKFWGVYLKIVIGLLIFIDLCNGSCWGKKNKEYLIKFCKVKKLLVKWMVKLDEFRKYDLI